MFNSFFLTCKKLWYNESYRNLLLQVLVIVISLALVMFMISNTQTALQKLGITTGFSFLFEEAGFDIGESLITFQSTNTYLRAYFVAILNTLKVSVLSIVFATLLGVAIGIARLSSNILVSKMAGLYIEVLRNTPQLVQIIFWYTLLVAAPAPREALSWFNVIFISNRGVHLPWPTHSPGYFEVGIALFLAIIITFFITRFVDWRRRNLGKTTNILWLNILIIVCSPIIVWGMMDAQLSVELPKLSGFNFIGGLTISPEFIAILFGLSLYISAFIAEIVRSGIQAIDRGQWEASAAIGFNTIDKYRYIILPQALRVIIPPAGAQYISLVKNSSLGSAIGYPELFNITNSIVTLSTNTLEPIAIMMAVYLTIAFTIALIMNLYNKAVAIKER